jgi:sugar lactone lactonase YvrE
MKKRIILILVFMALVAGFILFSETLSAKATKKPFNGLGKVLVQGAPIHGANGIMFDNNDMLYIASVMGREIVVMDPKSGRILDRLRNDLGVEGPDDLTFGPDGSLYWTSIMTGEVGRLTPGGVLSKQFVAPGVNPITFSDNGRLFVALDFLGDGLYELDPNLTAGPWPIIEATPSDPYPLGFLNGMDWGPDGFLYGPLWIPNLVVRIDVDLKMIVGVAAGGLSNPAAVKFDSQGNLHVAEQMSGEVSRLDLITGDKMVIATGLHGLDNLAFDSLDRLFVSHAGDGSIHQVLPSGQVRTVSKGGMIAPGGVAVMPGTNGGESVFVADLWTLREFNGQTGRPGIVERHDLTVPGDITSPLTVSPFGNNLVLSSWFGDVVQIWDPEMRVLEGEGAFMYPLNAIQFQSDIVVAELGTGSVIQWDPDTNGRVTLADSSDGIFVPAGLAATDGNLWVSDWATGVVWQILSPHVLSPVAMGLAAPEGLAVDQDGSLLVVEAGAGRLSRIDPLTGVVSIVVDGLELGAEAIPGLIPTWIFNGVAVGPSGYIYVTGDIANVLYRFKPTR